MSHIACVILIKSEKAIGTQRNRELSTIKRSLTSKRGKNEKVNSEILRHVNSHTHTKVSLRHTEAQNQYHSELRLIG